MNAQGWFNAVNPTKNVWRANRTRFGANCESTKIACPDRDSFLSFEKPEEIIWEGSKIRHTGYGHLNDNDDGVLYTVQEA